MKLPFFNRKRYIELKCYTNIKFDVETCPITISSKLPTMKPVGEVNSKVPDFSSCYGHVVGLKRSAVLRAWSEVCFEGLGPSKGISVSWSDGGGGLADIHTQDDPIYKSKTNVLTKVSTPWRLEETTGVHFVVAKHIRNLSPMAIPSGVTSFKSEHELNFFNLVNESQPKYTVKFNDPVLAIYPMSDLPLHVESIHDPRKHEELFLNNTRKPYFKGSALKVCKNNY